MFGQSVKYSSKAAYCLGHKMGCKSILCTAFNACVVKGIYQNVESEKLYYKVISHHKLAPLDPICFYNVVISFTFNCFLCLRFVSCVTVTAQLYNCSVG